MVVVQPEVTPADSSDAGVSFWDWDIMTRPALFSVDGLHPSREGNAVLHDATAGRIRQLLSPDRRHGFIM